MQQKRTISLAIAVMMMVTLGLGAVAQAETTYQSTLYITTGSNTSSFTWDTATYGSFVSAYSDNTTYANYSSNSGNYVYVYGVSAGTANIVVTTVDSSGNYHQIYQPVTVSGSTTSSTASTSVSLTTGQTDISNTYYTATSPSSSSPYVATATVYGSTGSQYVMIQGLSAGSATITYYYQTVSGGSSIKATIYVTVTSSSTSTSNTYTSTSANMELTAGKSYTLGTTYYSVNSVASSDSSVVSATTTGSEGSMKVSLSALKAGQTTITFRYQLAKDGVWNYGSTTVNVTGTASTSTTTSSSTSSTSDSGGITFTSSTRDVTIYSESTGKVVSRRISGIKLNGKSVKAADLRWVSSDTSVLTVNSQTGLYKGVGEGQANLICVDTDGKYVGCVAITMTDNAPDDEITDDDIPEE